MSGGFRDPRARATLGDAMAAAGLVPAGAAEGARHAQGRQGQARPHHERPHHERAHHDRPHHRGGGGRRPHKGRPDHQARPAAPPPRPAETEAQHAARHVNAARGREIARRRDILIREAIARTRQDQHRQKSRRAGLAPAAALRQEALAPLGRLVILTETDLACPPMIAVARAGAQAGLVCAYLDSDLYNAFGWFFEDEPPPAAAGEPGGAVDLAAFGMALDVIPREGAWSFTARRIGPPAPRLAGLWSRLPFGLSILHRRFKSDIEAGRAAEPDAKEKAALAAQKPSAAVAGAPENGGAPCAS